MGVSGSTIGWVVLTLLCALFPPSIPAQQAPVRQPVPPNFEDDSEFARRIRALVWPSTRPADGAYSTGKQVLEQLTRQLPQGRRKLSWELRIATDAGNMFSSPDGTIFVDDELGQFLGSQGGLWAAALAHEVAHVVHDDWARRYLFQKSLQEAASAQITIGAAGAPGGSWLEPRAAARLFAVFCQNLEFEADTEGLMLMARSGFHPAFMAALYHILQGQATQFHAEFVDSSHPLWQARAQDLSAHLALAEREFGRIWADGYSSPGGSPPIIVYLGTPSAQRNGGEVTVNVPLHCDNMYGSVEVVLHFAAKASDSPRELRQFTGCTSNHTFITFALTAADMTRADAGLPAMISVFSDRGDLLARSAPHRLR